MRITALFIAMLFSTMVLHAQLTRLGSTAKNNRIKKGESSRCATVPYLETLRKKHPKAATDEQFENWMNQQVAKRRNQPNLQAIVNYEIAIVFHIIHSGSSVGSSDNPSQSQIQAQLAQLNKDFSNLSNSPYTSASKTGISFCLANQDPDGNTLTEPGIHRLAASTITGLGTAPYTIDDIEALLKPATIWNPSKYLNVWITEIDESILGYATFPSASTLEGLDEIEDDNNAGVVVIPRSVGSYNTPNGGCNNSFPYKNGKTLTHELGHFFGLRHIWGDANCGNDYCNDTPVHEDANEGNFSHPKANTCGTTDEMFENYMDYTFDDQLNTFTLNQAERMQIVMLNSPRRAGLPISNVGKTCFTSNKIAFVPCTSAITVSETGNTGTCPRYKTLNLLLNVEDRASGTAVVSINNSGSASASSDFQIETPSLSFNPGDGFKVVSIRIFDDGIAEGTETLVISYTITGTGVSAGSNSQQLTITLLDDDYLTISQLPITVTNQNFDNSLVGWSTLSTPNAVNKFTVGTEAAGFSGGVGYVSNETSLGATAPHTYTIDDENSSAALLRSPLLSTLGLKNIKASFKWKCNGESDIFSAYDYGDFIYFTPNAATTPKIFVDAEYLVDQPTVTTFNYSLDNSFNNSSFYLGWYWENDETLGSQPPLAVDDFLVTGEGQTIESQVGHQRSNNVPASTKVRFLSTQDNEAIVDIENASAAINCVTAIILETGNGQTNIITEVGTFKRSAKVVSIIPAVNFNGTSTITLYFTQAEINIWGDAKSSLKIMQVTDGVNLSSTITNANAKIITPTYGDFIATNGMVTYSFTATGFSQFFLVEAATVLPVNFTDVTAQSTTGGIQVLWKTANEYNNKGFEVLRSSNGNQFSTIGFVAGKGNTTIPGTYQYSFFDETAIAGTLYYYRLRQIDFDGKYVYSTVRTAKWTQNIQLKITPNPAKGKVLVQANSQMYADIRLITFTGQIVKTWQHQWIPAGGLSLDLSKIMVGIYQIQVLSEGLNSSSKLIIE